MQHLTYKLIKEKVKHFKLHFHSSVNNTSKNSTLNSYLLKLEVRENERSQEKMKGAKRKRKPRILIASLPSYLSLPRSSTTRKKHQMNPNINY